MTTNNILAGWDPGFDANKFARIQNGEIVTYALPSSVGEANRGKKDGLTLAGVVRGRRNGRRPFNVAFDGMEFLVGPNVTHYTEPIDRMDFNRFTDSPELRATFYAGIYHITAGGVPIGSPWPLLCRLRWCNTRPTPSESRRVSALGWLVNTASASMGWKRC